MTQMNTENSPAKTTSADEIDEQAKAILMQNDLGNFTIPTKRLYPYQWNWDSAFCALGIATYDMNRAYLELESLVEAQWSDGMIPHIVFRNDDPDYFPGPSVWGANKTPPSSGISQPPVLASILLQLDQRDEALEYKENLKKLIPKISAWHKWFHQYRDPDGLGIIAAVHPWETGRDNSAEWDQPLSSINTEGIGEYTRRDTGHVDPEMRPKQQEYDQYLSLVKFGKDVNWEPVRIAKDCPFFVADVGLTMILLRADRDLLKLTTKYSFHDLTDEIEGRIKILEAGISRLWNPQVGAFTAIDLRTGIQMNHITSNTFLGYYAGVVSAEQDEHLMNNFDRIQASVKFGVPSLDPEHSKFDSIRYWLGPTWAMINYLIAMGFNDYKYYNRAKELRKSTQELIETYGFFEYFCPKTGQGCGGTDFSWTAAMWLAWTSPNQDAFHV